MDIITKKLKFGQKVEIVKIAILSQNFTSIVLGGVGDDRVVI